MTACTERQPAALDDGIAGEGQKGMPGPHSMTACTERQPAALDDGVAGEGVAGAGQDGMPGEGAA
jgi:hypothetical protein